MSTRTMLLAVRLLAVGLMSLLLVADSLAQTISFGSATNFAAGDFAKFVAIRDFNRDGKPDLAVANIGAGTVSILLVTGPGSFGAKTDFPAGPGPSSLAVGDFNRDGKLDLAVANAGGPGTVSILLGDDTGGFGPPVPFAVLSGTVDVVAADFNRDGNLDLATANPTTGSVSVLLGNGDGTFVLPAASFGVGIDPRSLAAGDFNRDGKPDLAVANRLEDTISVLLGNGDGTFVTPAPKTAITSGPSSIGTNPRSIAVGDLNRDGRPDLVTANSGQGGGGSFSVLLGIGDGSFGVSGPPIEAGPFPIFVAIGDLNGDGKLDLAVVNEELTAAFVVVFPGTGTGSFGSPLIVSDSGCNPPGCNAESVAIGDLNGDGRPDLVTANVSSDNVSVFPNTTAFSLAGSFGAATNFAVGAPADGFTDGDPFVAIADLNRDGTLDLAVVNQPSNNVAVLLGTGTGSFGAATNFAVGNTPTAVAIGDLNRDGKLDLVVANSGVHNVSILLGNGGGAFGAATSFAVGLSPTSVAIADVNRDGKPDLAVANAASDTVSILLGTGTGSFGAATNFTVGTSPASVAIGDLNGDGKPDLAVANFSNDNNVSILLGNGDGTFGAATNFAVGNLPHAVAIGDLNQDGKLDLAVADQGSDTVSILLGTGTGSFGPATSFTVGSSPRSPRSVALGDLNRDGKLDLAAANVGGNTVAVLLALESNDGTFGGATNFAVGNGPNTVAIGDFNRDGKPDLAVANGHSNNISILLNTSPNQPPVAVNDSYTVPEDTTLFIGPSGVLANDTDPDGNPLTAALVSGPSSGTVNLNPNGSFTFTPVADFNGTATFTYQASDGTAQSNIATVTITVAPVNDGPVASPAAVTTAEDTAVLITLGATDIDSTGLSFSIVNPPAHGTLSAIGAVSCFSRSDPSTTTPGATCTTSVIYTPAANYFGPDTFNFSVSDSKLSSTATASVTVTAVNDPPVLTVPGSITVNEGTPINFTVTATDVDGPTPLKFAVSNLPPGATLTPNGTSAAFTWTPNAAQGGPSAYSVEISACDGQHCDAKVVSITVNDTMADRDGDGVTDAQDNCPDDPNANQAEVCHNSPQPIGATQTVTQFDGQIPVTFTATVTNDRTDISFLPPTLFTVHCQVINNATGNVVPVEQIPESGPFVLNLGEVNRPGDLVKVAASATATFSTTFDLRIFHPTLANGSYTTVCTYVQFGQILNPTVDDPPLWTGEIQAPPQTIFVGRYTFSGFFSPLPGARVSQRNTVPVKFALKDSAGASVKNCTCTLTFQRLDSNGNPIGTPVPATPTSGSGNQFKYDPKNDQYVFTMASRSLPPGSVQLQVNLHDGSALRTINIVVTP